MNTVAQYPNTGDSPMMTITDLCILAQKYRETGPMASSAQCCLEDAYYLIRRHDFAAARERAIKSLAYSIGILHPDYQKATATL